METMIGDPEEDAAARVAELQGEIRACDRCGKAGLIAVAHPVFRGLPGQRMMVVGQAPAERGHEAVLPYAGATGVTLRAWLARAGMGEGELEARFYLTSLTKCFPGKSAGGKGDRSPSSTEIGLCAGHLDREIRLVRPALVLTLGRLSANVLLGPGSLDELVGEVWDGERAGNRFRAIALPHPSGVSRWMNLPENRVKHERALARLGEIARELE